MKRIITLRLHASQAWSHMTAEQLAEMLLGPFQMKNFGVEVVSEKTIKEPALMAMISHGKFQRPPSDPEE